MATWHDPVGWWEARGRPLRRLPRAAAALALLAVVLALVWASLATASLARGDNEGRESWTESQIGDVALYERITTRVAAGENYYAAAMDEQRSHAYPTAPFVTVRLPTLAYIGTLLGLNGWRIIALTLVVGTIMAWLVSLEGLANRWERSGAALLLFLGALGLFFERGMRLHELPAGLLLTLALALMPARRLHWAGLLVAALALAIRELALPFIMLWGAFALAQRQWRVLATVGAILVLFAVAMILQAQAVAAHRLPGDLVSQGWSAMQGPQLALYGLAKKSALASFVPMWLAGPIALLPLIGWIGLGGRLGLFASLWFIGFGLAVALFARISNVYWVLMLMPAYGAGFAFMPRALADLVLAAFKGQENQV